jgi:hypothetical protein
MSLAPLLRGVKQKCQILQATAVTFWCFLGTSWVVPRARDRTADTADDVKPLVPAAGGSQNSHCSVVVLQRDPGATYGQMSPTYHVQGNPQAETVCV